MHIQDKRPDREQALIKVVEFLLSAHGTDCLSAGKFVKPCEHRFYTNAVCFALAKVLPLAERVASHYCYDRVAGGGVAVAGHLAARFRKGVTFAAGFSIRAIRAARAASAFVFSSSKWCLS